MRTAGRAAGMSEGDAGMTAGELEEWLSRKMADFEAFWAGETAEGTEDSPGLKLLARRAFIKGCESTIRSG
jgi:hypothetical protein